MFQTLGNETEGRRRLTEQLSYVHDMMETTSHLLCGAVEGMAVLIWRL